MTTQKTRMYERQAFILEVLVAEGIISKQEANEARQIEQRGEGQQLGRKMKEKRGRGANSDE